MKKLLTALLSLTFGLNLAFAGNESGHGGDPLIQEFYHRANFVLTRLKERELKKELLDVFEKGVSELRAEMTDENLPSTGRVVDDPKRPGKKMVLLDRKKYYVEIAKKSSREWRLGA